MVPKTKVKSNGEVLVDQPSAQPTTKVAAAAKYGALYSLLLGVVVSIADSGVDTTSLRAFGLSLLGVLVAVGSAYLKRTRAAR